VIFAAGFLSSRLPAQTDLQPGREDCYQSLRHASSAVLRYLEDMGNQASRNSANLGSPVVRQRAADSVEKVAIATDVIMHCVSTTTPASEIQATLLHEYKGRAIEETGTPPITGTAMGRNHDKFANADMRIAVSIPAATPQLRVVELRFGTVNDRASLQLLFEPSKTMIDLITPTGKRLPTNLPDGFVRVVR